jgi:hypothetical protein
VLAASAGSRTLAAGCGNSATATLDEIGALVQGDWAISYGTGTWIAPDFPLPFPIFADMDKQTIRIVQHGNQLQAILPGGGSASMDLRWERESMDLMTAVFSSAGIAVYEQFLGLPYNSTSNGFPPPVSGACPISLGSDVKLVGTRYVPMSMTMDMDILMIVHVEDTRNMYGILSFNGNVGRKFAAWRRIKLTR